MNGKITFLHTAEVHVATFTTLLNEMAPDVAALHIVRDDLLRDAQKSGTGDPSLVGKVQAAMKGGAEAGSPVVVCTCSTIGGIAEAVETAGRFQAMRIDREMADRAVQAGARILLVAALESTLGPTESLIRDSARRAGKSVTLRNLVLADTWKHFQAGDIERFTGAIADAVRKQAGDAQVIVLAQASMAPAQAKLGNLGVPVLSSPRLGVEAALRRLRESAGG